MAANTSDLSLLLHHQSIPLISVSIKLRAQADGRVPRIWTWHDQANNTTPLSSVIIKGGEDMTCPSNSGAAYLRLAREVVPSATLFLGCVNSFRSSQLGMHSSAHMLFSVRSLLTSPAFLLYGIYRATRICGASRCSVKVVLGEGVIVWRHAQPTGTLGLPNT